MRYTILISVNATSFPMNGQGSVEFFIVHWLFFIFTLGLPTTTAVYVVVYEYLLVLYVVRPEAYSEICNGREG